MKIRKFKKINKFRKIINDRKRIFEMKYVELSGNAYPLNDRVMYVTEIQSNGGHELYLSYTDNPDFKVLLSDITNQKNLSLEEKILFAYKGKRVFIIS
ncbi:hypothetical protein [Burkholderia vietnamiensis]|uniref:hypothetical protein n=1 Tax=Burkholderia vietnamiensis TaxID=60552 RepID=UPI001589FC84|nr:hypothetical protein [Burkholderia vietnamiensis]